MKQYNNEKAIISLTSWKGRINQVGKVIYSIFKQCPGFHIVLVLSKAEFPLQEKELPQDLLVLLNHNIFELLWVEENYKSLKKVLYTMDKYREVPVISADDDCLYTCNYAEILYNAWHKTHSNVVTLQPAKAWKHTCQQYGECTLHAPYCYGPHGLIALNRCANEFLIEDGNDDHFLSALREVLHIYGYNILKIRNTSIHTWYNNKSTIGVYGRCAENGLSAYDRCEAIIRKELLRYFKETSV